MLSKRTPGTATDTITIQVPNGYPCGYDTRQVTTAEVRAIEDAPSWTRAERRMVAAYYRAGGE